MNRWAGLVFLIATVAIAGARTSVAQDYPPPPTSPQDCEFVVRGEMAGEFVVGRAEAQGEVRAEGGDGCSEPGGEVNVRVDNVSLGTTQAGEDGSFVETFKLPAAVTPGDHRAIAEMDGRSDVDHPLEVIGATVLGTSVTRNADDGGILPRSGADFMLLLLWAVILVTMGTMLVVSARTWRRRMLLARSHRGNAVWPAEVPYVDTSRFVPRYDNLRRADQRD